MRQVQPIGFPGGPEAKTRQRGQRAHQLAAPPVERHAAIAAELGISVKTVEKHREHLIQKLNIHDTAGLTRYAISTGIIESSVQLTIVRCVCPTP